VPKELGKEKSSDTCNRGGGPKKGKKPPQKKKGKDIAKKLRGKSTSLLKRASTYETLWGLEARGEGSTRRKLHKARSVKVQGERGSPFWGKEGKGSSFKVGRKGGN